MKLKRIDSVGELRHCAPGWDDLWWRSSSTLPTHRAELVAQWVDHFGADGSFTALAVEDDGQLIAALPLHAVRKAGMKIGQLTANCWSDSGTLLLDESADAAAAIRLLQQGARGLGWPVWIFDGIDLHSNAWRRWHEMLTLQGVGSLSKPKYRIGLIDITHNWDAYVAAWSSNHRRSIKKLRRAAEKDGPAELLALTDLSSDAIEPYLHAAFEIEDKSWKGRAGTSILRNPGMYDFFRRQAQQLAQWGQFELYFLHFRGEPIAFDFCYCAKGVLSSHKIGYHHDFRNYGPFQLLRSYQLQALHSDPQRRLLNTLGILGEANAKWSTRYCQSSRLIAAGGNTLGQAALCGYKHIWPALRKCLRRGEQHVPELEPGAARLLEKRPETSATQQPAEPAVPVAGA